jgi:Domain of unknown function (DUF3883)
MASYILETAIQNYLRERPSKKDFFDGLEEKRMEFVSRFPIKKIPNIRIKDYVQGFGSKESFCWWMENGLKILGDIHGGTAEKFGVYYSQDDKDYRSTKKFARGGNTEEAFHNVKQAISDLLIAGKMENLKAIESNPISPMLKGKILSTYFPERYLDIYYWFHLNFFLEQLNLYGKNLGNREEVQKREILIKLRNNHPILREWSLQEFVKFLYWHIGHPREFNPKELPESADALPETPVFPPISEVHIEFLDTLPTQEDRQKDRTRAGKRNPGKTDFEAEYRLNQIIGERGEFYVVEIEKQWLLKHNQPELANQIKHTSQEDDGAGFDIESFNLDGTPKYIEVKATRRKPGTAIFFLTENELQTARNLESFHIYVVFDVLSLIPKIWRWPHPFKEEQINVKREPILYRVTYWPE